MTINILDTNVLIRLLVGDNIEQQKQASLWFAEAENNKRKIIIDPIVIAEVSFVLETFYKKERDEIADALEVFISQRWLHVKDRDILVGLWFWYRQGFHFVDSFLLTWSKINKNNILTFDQKVLKK